MGRHLPVPSAVSSHGGGHIILASGRGLAWFATAGLAAFALLALIDNRGRTGWVYLLRGWRGRQGVADSCDGSITRRRGWHWRCRRGGHRRTYRRRFAWRSRNRRSHDRWSRHGRGGYRWGLSGHRRCNGRGFNRRRLAWRGPIRNRRWRRHFDWRFAGARLFLALRGSYARQRERYREQDFGHS